jgi:hypothetical protein
MNMMNLKNKSGNIIQPSKNRTSPILKTNPILEKHLYQKIILKLQPDI